MAVDPSVLSIRLGKRSATAILCIGLIQVAHPALAKCKPGYVERHAGHSDQVCVSPESRERAQKENARAVMLWGAGSYGPRTCAMGFVWREAFVGDLVCVREDIRTLVEQENQLAKSRAGQ